MLIENPVNHENRDKLDPRARSLLLKELEPGEEILWASFPKYAAPSWHKKVLSWMFAAIFLAGLLTILYNIGSLLIFMVACLLSCVFLGGSEASCIPRMTLLCCTNRRFLEASLNLQLSPDTSAFVDKPRINRTISTDYKAIQSVRILDERDGIGKLVLLAKTKNTRAIDYVPDPRLVCSLLPLQLEGTANRPRRS